MTLDREPDTASAQKKMERLLEEPRAVAMADCAIVNPLIPTKDRAPPELKDPLTPEGAEVQHHPPGLVDVIGDGFEGSPVHVVVHPEHPGDLFRPGLPPSLLSDVFCVL
jgi:hypothetical protein